VTVQTGSVQRVCSDVFDGRAAIVQHTLHPGALSAPRHRHAREDELSIVVAGEMGVLLGDSVVTAAAGSYVLKPRGQWHTFWNAGATQLRVVELIVPGGFEECFDRLAPMLNATVPPPREVVARVAAEYGIEFDFDGVGEICRRFGLTAWPPM
jgi:quercetin dioxygenase-like cupin family protein